MTNSNLQSSFSKQTSVSRSFPIQKGQLNNYRFRQAVLNEHVETAREVQGVVTPTNIVGQIFKASQDNINGLALTLESAAGVIFDDFESYADSAALQLVWIETTNAAELEEAFVPPGGSTKAMAMPTDALGDEWVKTITPTDYTDYTGVFEFAQTHLNNQIQVNFFIGDGTNTKSIPLVVTDVNEYLLFQIDENALVEDQAGITDSTQITKVGYRITDNRVGGFAYVDDMVAVPPPGSVKLKLFDLGSEIPADGVTSLADGEQYTTLGDLGLNGGVVAAEVDLNMVGGKREYFAVKFAAGPAIEIPGNELIIPDNYYALTINYVDTNVSVYGANPAFETVYYNNGYAFTTPDEQSVINKIGEFNDIQFCIFSTQNVHLNTLIKMYDAAPGNNARENVRIENAEMHIEGIIAQDNTPIQQVIAEFDDRFYYFPKGGKFEVNHSDDFADDTTQINITIGYIYQPPIING